MKIVEHSYTHKQKFSSRKKTTEIVLHCAATPEGKDYTTDKIDKWHKDRGFNCIGYHFVIYRDGSIHQGRPVWSVGGHCTNHNSNSVGICYIGGMDADNKHAKDTRTEEQKNSLIELVKYLMERYNITLDKVKMHRDLCGRKKACPSFEKVDFDKEFVASC